MAPLVAAAAVDDFAVFSDILRPAGMELALMADAVARQLGLEAGGLPLAMAGSFLLRCEPVARVVLEELSDRGYAVEARPVPEPVAGALLLARRAWRPP